jgi:nucleoside phosphorylase
MIADRKWVERNLGFDPISTPAPAETFAFAPAANAQPANEDLLREIIDFDSQSPHGMEFLAFTRSTGLSRYEDVPWPRGLAPKTGRVNRKPNQPLPKADILVVTWTVDEGHALSRVLTPGKDTGNDYQSYTHNYESISKRMRAGCPARQAGRLGAYWTTQIGKQKVLIFKSDSHMSQDGPLLPNIDVWRQIINEVKPKFVITTGTAGGIGKQFEVGDVIVSPVVRFYCTAKFKNFKHKNASIAQAYYSTTVVNRKHLDKAKQLFKVNADRLPPENPRQPKIIVVAPQKLSAAVVTTDFFGFDTSSNYYKLKGLGDVSEMGDAVLGLVCQEMGANAPRWVAVRNVSDPQIKSDGLTIREQAKIAAQIYKGFGRWSSVCSAIVSWALIAAE